MRDCNGLTSLLTDRKISIGTTHWHALAHPPGASRSPERHARCASRQPTRPSRQDISDE